MNHIADFIGLSLIGGSALIYLVRFFKKAKAGCASACSGCSSNCQTKVKQFKAQTITVHPPLKVKA